MGRTTCFKREWFAYGSGVRENIGFISLKGDFTLFAASKDAVVPIPCTEKEKTSSRPWTSIHIACCSQLSILCLSYKVK